jgi:sugar phosphate isomerase/epimerase
MTYDPKNGELVGELLKKYSLKGLGAHIGIDAIEKDLDTVIGFLDNLGTKCFSIPWVGGEFIETEEKTRETARRFDAAAKKLAEMGYELGFHNHTVEFEKKFNGKTIIDIFFEETQFLKFQVDAGWAYNAGADVPAVLNKLGDRLLNIHIKDIDNNRTPTEIGSGNVDYKAVIETAANLGIEWGIVEQDACVNYKPFESIKVSYDYIKTVN